MRGPPFRGVIKIPLVLVPGRYLFICKTHGTWQGRTEEGQCKDCHCLGRVAKYDPPLFDTEPMNPAPANYDFFTTRRR